MNRDNHHNAPSIDEPCPTVACQNRLGLVKCQFLSKQFGGDPSGKNIDLEQPAGTVTCKDHHALVSSKFITEYYGGSNHNHSIEEPATTVTTMARHAFVSAFYGRGFNSSIDGPAPTVTTKDRMSLVQTQFIDNQYGRYSVISRCAIAYDSQQSKAMSGDLQDLAHEH